MDLRPRPSHDDSEPESVRVLPPAAGSVPSHASLRPQSRSSVAGPVILLVAVLIAGGAGLLYGYSLGDDAPSETDAEAAAATSVPATVPPTTAAPATPFPAIESPFTPAGRGHLVPDGATEWLNANTVSAVAIHPDGSLWSAGPGGVVQWDLGDGTHVRHTTTDGTGPIGAHDLAITDDGDVWVIGEARISHWDGQEWRRQHRLRGGRTARLAGLATTSDGSIWVGSADWEQDEFAFHRAPGTFDAGVESYSMGADGTMLRSGPDGSLWAVLDGDLWQFADERWTQAADTGFPWIDEVAIGPGGDVLIASEGRVSRWSSGSLTPIPDDGQRLVNHAVDGFIRWIVVDTSGVSWVVAHSFDADGETTELIRLEDLTRFAVPAEFTSRPVADADGTLWMGTDDGIIGFNDGSWRTLRVEDSDSPLRWVDSMAVDANGTLWMAGADEITSWDGESWSVVDGGDLLENPSAGDRPEGPTWVAAGANGSLWAGVGCQAAARRAGAWVPIGGPADVERAGFCWAADRAVGDDGSLYLLVEASIESARGVHRWHEASWSMVAEIGPDVGLFDIDVAPDGTLWGAGHAMMGASGRGVMRLEDGEWITVLGGLDIEAIAAAADGSIWVAEPCWWCPGDSGGIWRFADGSWTREMELRVSDMVTAADGTLWVIGHNSQSQSAAWRYEDGRFRPLLSVEPFTAVAAGPDGSGWLATTGRLLHIPGS